MRSGEACFACDIWPDGSEAFCDCVEGCGVDADLGDGGDEVDVAVPAGDEVYVEVSRDACAACAALVESDVDALRFEGAFDEQHCCVDEGPEGGSLSGCVVEESCAALAEGDEEMAVGVGVFVEEDHAGGGSIADAREDVVRAVLFGVFPVFAEEGWFGRRWCFGGVGVGVLFVALVLFGEGLEVLESPGGVEDVRGRVVGVGLIGHAGYRVVAREYTRRVCARRVPCARSVERPEE